MQTDSVSRLNQVVLLLRQQLLARAGKGAKGVATPTMGRGFGPRTHKRELSKVVSARLATLRIAGINNPALLKRAFVEQVLISGLGEHLINEAGFQEMVDEVLTNLTQDQVLGRLLEVVVDPTERDS